MSPSGAMSCWKPLTHWDEEGPGGPRTLPSSRDVQGEGRERVLPWACDACSSCVSVRAHHVPFAGEASVKHAQELEGAPDAWRWSFQTSHASGAFPCSCSAPADPLLQRDSHIPPRHPRPCHPPQHSMPWEEQRMRPHTARGGSGNAGGEAT